MRRAISVPRQGVGAFEYTSGLIAENPPTNVNIDTPVGGIGVRSTQFIVRRGIQARTVEIALIHGSVSVTPILTKKVTLLTGPIKIMLSDRAVASSGLSPDEYDVMKATLVTRLTY